MKLFQLFVFTYVPAPGYGGVTHKITGDDTVLQVSHVVDNLEEEHALGMGMMFEAEPHVHTVHIEEMSA